MDEPCQHEPEQAPEFQDHIDDNESPQYHLPNGSYVWMYECRKCREFIFRAQPRVSSVWVTEEEFYSK